MDRQDQIRQDLIEKKLQAGIIKLSSRFDFDMDSIKVDSVLGVITIKNDPVYLRLLSSCHGGSMPMDILFMKRIQMDQKCGGNMMPMGT